MSRELERHVQGEGDEDRGPSRSTAHEQRRQCELDEEDADGRGGSQRGVGDEERGEEAVDEAVLGESAQRSPGEPLALELRQRGVGVDRRHEQDDELRARRASAIAIAVAIAGGMVAAKSTYSVKTNPNGSCESATNPHAPATRPLTRARTPSTKNAASRPPIDAGSPPVIACTDAGMMCAMPPSDCLDEHTMRYFSGGTCNDAGTCDFTILTMKCDPSPVPPDCFQGGCRVVIVR